MRVLRERGPFCRGDERGMSMIEVVVAMVLMAVALLALAASYPYAMYGVATSGLQTAATLLAQQAIEQARNAEYGSLDRLSFDGSSGTLPTACGGSADFRPVAAFVGLSRCVAVQPGVPTSTMTTITAVVEFGGAPPSLVWRTTVVTVRAG